MSIQMAVRMACDICGETYQEELPGMDDPVGRVRALMEPFGWSTGTAQRNVKRRRRGTVTLLPWTVTVDYCPRCAKARSYNPEGRSGHE